MPWIRNRPLRVAIWWQVLFVAVCALFVGLLSEGHRGAISAILGGLISIVAATSFAIIVSRHKGYGVGDTVRTALRAEAVKIIVIVLSLWLVLSVYKEVNALVFTSVFVVTVVINSVALLVADNK